MVELSPIPGFIASDFLAAKLVYKIIGYVSKSYSELLKKESATKKEAKKNFDVFLESNFELEIWAEDKIVFQSEERGLKGLLDFIAKSSHKFKGSVIFDKKVGRGVALLVEYLGAKMVFGKVGSKLAEESLKNAKIDFYFKETVEKILNKNGNDMCPIEKLSIEKTPEDFLKALKEKE